MGNVPSKAAKHWKMKGPYSTTYHQIGTVKPV